MTDVDLHRVLVLPAESARHRAAPAAPGSPLPSPPTDAERDAYLAATHRWVPLASAFGGILTTASLIYLARSQVWAIPLLIPLAVTVVGGVLALVSSLQLRRDTIDGHRRRVASYPREGRPSVDVFLPSAGENLDVLANTFHHVRRMRWGGVLRIWVLDDSDRAEVRNLARDYGFDYRSRPDRGHLKKAGNLNYGLAQSNGEHVVILDADFVPRPDFLNELMPYSTEDDIGIIQSPQFFDLNPSSNWVQYAAGSTQILFYRWIQAARDRSDSSICVGTCAIYRRAALESIGGFPRIGHSEDVYTGIDMTGTGFRTRYVPIVVSKGLCPDTLEQFSTQQYRWCTGSMSLLFSSRFHRATFTTMQRVSFWAGFLYYIDTALAVFVIALPPILMAVLAPDAVDVRNYVFVFLAMMVRQAMVPVITMGRDSNIGLTRIQTLYSFAHAIALFDVLRGRTDAWQATGVKGASPTPGRVRRLAVWWIVLVQVLTWSTALWRAPVYGWVDYAPMMAFAVLNLIMVYPILFWRLTFPSVLDPMTPRRRLSGLVA